MSVTHLPAPGAARRRAARAAGAPGPAELGRLAAAVAASPALWRPVVRFCTEQRWYYRIELPEPGYEMWLLSWLPGQRTGFHDHGGASGAFAVADGELLERAGRPGSRELRARAVAAGQVRSFGPQHLHDVVNAGPRPAVSVHAYAPELSLMRRYEMTGAGLALTDTEAAGDGW